VDVVLLDTCVLLKSYLCDTLLSVAEAGMFRPLWSEHILAELRRNLVKAGAKQEAVEHRLGQMAASFPDARVTGYESFIGLMTNHPKDRHVLVPLEYSIEGPICASASRRGVGLVSLPGAAQDRVLAHVPGAQLGRPVVPRRLGEGCGAAGAPA
jgi:hypothetical protein